jgi:cobalt-zinc-cadmium efflux system membrane fusion protein
MHKLYLVALATLLCCSAASAQLVAITPQQVERLGIKVAPVRVAGSQTIVSVLGQVTPAPDSRVPVSAPFAGTVKSLVRLEGSSVQKGDALAVIVSADMHAAHARLQGQQANYRSAKAAADRANALVKEGIAPASRAEEANAAASAAAADLAASRSIMTRASRAEDGSYQLLAPAAGRVARLEVSAGDQVAAMQLVALIDTRREMWVEGALPASAIGRVASGDHVVLEGANGAVGEVVAAGSSIDPKTRSAMLRARLEAPVGLVAGQTVRLSVTRRSAAGSFNIPRAAVVELKDGPAVFVARNRGFEAVPVRVLARGVQDATVGGMLGIRDRVAVTGVSELKAASMRK